MNNKDKVLLKIKGINERKISPRLTLRNIDGWITIYAEETGTGEFVLFSAKTYGRLLEMLESYNRGLYDRRVPVVEYEWKDSPFHPEIIKYVDLIGQENGYLIHLERKPKQNRWDCLVLNGLAETSFSFGLNESELAKRHAEIFLRRQITYLFERGLNV